MARQEASYRRSPSTTWEWRKVKIQGPRPTQHLSATSGARSTYVPRRDARKPLCVEIRYSGSAEAWWVVKGRGHTWRFPGHWCLDDVLQEVNGPFWRAPGA